MIRAVPLNPLISVNHPMAYHTQSPADLFRTALISIYRHWYLLPPKSARRHLDRARHQLGAGLREAGDASQKITDFLGLLKMLNGVANAAGPTLDQAEAHFARGAVTLSSSEQQELVALLTVPDPAIYALGEMNYVRRDLPTTLKNALDRLAIGREKLPSDVQEQLDFAQKKIDAFAKPKALSGFIPLVGQEILGGGEAEFIRLILESLEQIPTVVRIANDIFLQGKVEGESASTRTLSKGSDSLSSASPVPSSLPAIELTGDRNSLESTKSSAEIPLFTNVRFPSSVPKQTTTPLIVQLTIDPPNTESRVQGNMPLVPFADPAEPEYLDVILNAPGFAEETGIWARTIQVYSDQDSQPAIFLLKAEEEGEQLVTVEFRHNGRHISSAAFQTTISSSTSYGSNSISRSTNVAFEREKPFGTEEGESNSATTLDLSKLPTAPPQPADLELRVLKDKRENTLHFLLHSTNAKVGYHWRNMGSIELTSNDPQTFFEEKFSRLSTLAFQSAGLDPQTVTSLAQEIEQMGEELFEELFPEALRTEYWKRIKPLSDAGTIRTLLITSDEPWIPWELIKPYQQDEYSGEEQQDEFLSLSFQMCRWLAGRTPAGAIDIAAASVIAPDVNLPNAEREVAYLRTLNEKELIKVGPRLETLSQVKQLARQGEIQLLHVATHGQFNSESPDQSALMLAQNEALLLSDFSGSGGSGLRKARPIVFLNACHSGRTGQSLTLSGLGGWAGRMVKNLNVSAFAGSLWEVNDVLAADFAITFYDELIAGKTLAEAFHQARTTVRDLQPGNSTWLAYTLYGDPNAQVTFMDAGARSWDLGE